MNRPATLVLMLAAGLATACSNSPSKVLNELEEAAVRGDPAAFGSHFSTQSRPFAEALLSIQKEAWSGEKTPIEKFSRSRIASEKISGDTALVLTIAPDGTEVPVFFVREAGAWKLDAASTASGRPQSKAGDE
ncbi:MAG TPA: hypothetical protein PKH54_02890 [Myxococcota bacterium]|nr:hypothetical protein [Myxococcota bacterium]HOC98863.1 hypothetical protein [Myxococcota bacterium]HOH75765.1 hypothetical protein [Myxococcota bacterium]HPV03289.1 hypothetical protein [Myxococcota bacterium]